MKNSKITSRLLPVLFGIWLSVVPFLLHAQESVPEVSNDRNWVSSISYDFAGQTMAKGVSYFNSLGKATQQQSWDILSDRSWASEIRYDYLGRPVLQTLSAPVGSGFGYRSNFIMAGAVPLQINHYDSPATLMNPAAITAQTNSLGWYYSTSNTYDPYQDGTSYPFSRIVYSDLNPGQARALIGGNKITVGGVPQWLQPYSFVMPIEREVTAASFYDTFRDKKITKTVARDVHGVETVAFTDYDGNVLGAARSGNEESTPALRNVYSQILDKGYVDVHVPKGCAGLVVVENIVSLQHNIRIYDLITEQLVTSNLSGNISLNSGLYRFEDQNNYYGLNNSTTNPVTPIKIKYNVNYYDLSRNYYDYAGRLTKSVQPLISSGQDPLENTFTYNSLDQLLVAVSPDEGTAAFKYRLDGQLRFSQNQEQAKVNAFSYSNYDNLGRPLEGGVYTGTGILFGSLDAIVDQPDGLPATGRSEQQFSQYDVPDPTLVLRLQACFLPLPEYLQTFVSGNVTTTKTQNPTTSQTWYSYDVFGRVRWIIQDIPGLSCLKTIDYEYDPAKGQLLRIIYQKHNKSEIFIHRYQYNPAGQLTDVHTAVENSPTAVYTRRAHYVYNESGALKRTELADNLQGIDYVYNLGGQLKAINHPSLLSANDPGGDGTNGFAADVFGMALDYYAGDYTRSNSPKPVTSTPQGTNQYNGNIKASRWNTETASATQNGYTYSYNKNNWISGATFGTANSTSVFTANAANDYQMANITYDANGNLKTLKRNGYTDYLGTTAMDNFEYKNKGNRLEYVKDAGDNPDTNRYNDIRDQDVAVQTGVVSGIPIFTHLANYIYNDLGQLTIDLQEQITYEYDSEGLVTKIGELSSVATSNLVTLYNQDYPVAQSNTPHLTYVFPAYICADLAASTVFTSYMERFEGVGTKTISRLRVSPNAVLQLDIDLLIDKKLRLSPPPPPPGQIQPIEDEGDPALVGPEVIPQVIINVKSFDGTILATQTIANQPADYCNRLFYEHVNFSFNNGAGEYVVVEMIVSNNQAPFTDGKQRVFVDNIKLQAAEHTRMALFYNDRGQRVRKESYAHHNYTTKTYYVRDGAGMCMAIYTEDVGQGTGVTLTENGLYGINPIGVFKRDLSLQKGYALYQLSDYLGNVRAVIRKTSSGLLAITAKTDYYPFGMPMPNRHTTDGNYRYAFQGQEKDIETDKEAFELRLWDGRLGRWLTVDPKHQHVSPYMGMGNNPISVIDPDGGEDWHYDDAGNLVADKGDNAETLATFLGISLDAAQAEFNHNFRRYESTLAGGEIFYNTKIFNTTFGADFDLTFNVIGIFGDAGETLDQVSPFGRYYIENNKFIHLKTPIRAFGIIGDAYDMGSGAYKIINSKTEAERNAHITSTGVDGVIIFASRRHPAIGVAYSTLKIVGNSDMYKKAALEASREAYLKKHGCYPDGVNHTATLKQDPGMYKECATCPTKYR
ncbi:MAG TPA: RHS repeat-associated core domain-containing protein [Flavobacterium sp.]|jgi:RHS repeat-associated protein